MGEETKNLTPEQRKERYKKMYLELLPDLEPIRKKLEECGENEMLCVYLTSKGYISMNVPKSGWEVSRVSADQGNTVTFSGELKETLEF